MPSIGFKLFDFLVFLSFYTCGTALPHFIHCSKPPENNHYPLHSNTIKKQQISAIKLYPKHTINSKLNQNSRKTLRFFCKASFAYVKASTALPRPLANHPQKGM